MGRFQRILGGIGARRADPIGIEGLKSEAGRSGMSSPTPPAARVTYISSRSIKIRSIFPGGVFWVVDLHKGLAAWTGEVRDDTEFFVIV